MRNVALFVYVSLDEPTWCREKGRNACLRALSACVKVYSYKRLSPSFHSLAASRCPLLLGNSNQGVGKGGPRAPTTILEQQKRVRF